MSPQSEVTSLPDVNKPRDKKTILTLNDDEGITYAELPAVGWYSKMLKFYRSRKHPALGRAIRSWTRRARRIVFRKGRKLEYAVDQPVFRIGDFRTINNWKGQHSKPNMVHIRIAADETGLGDATIRTLIKAGIVDGTYKPAKWDGAKQRAQKWQNTWFVDLDGLKRTQSRQLKAVTGKRVFDIAGNDFYPRLEWLAQFPPALRKKVHVRSWMPREYGGNGRNCSLLGRPLACDSVDTAYRHTSPKGHPGKLVVISGSDRRLLKARLQGHDVPDPKPTPTELRKMVEAMHAAARGEPINSQPMASAPIQAGPAGLPLPDDHSHWLTHGALVGMLGLMGMGAVAKSKLMAKVRKLGVEGLQWEDRGNQFAYEPAFSTELHRLAQKRSKGDPEAALCELANQPTVDEIAGLKALIRREKGHLPTSV